MLKLRITVAIIERTNASTESVALPESFHAFKCEDLSFHAGVVWTWGAELLEETSESFIVYSYEVSESVSSALTPSPLFFSSCIGWIDVPLPSLSCFGRDCSLFVLMTCLISCSKAFSVFGSVFDGIFLWADFLLAAFMPTFKWFFDLLSFSCTWIDQHLVCGLNIPISICWLFFLNYPLKCGFQTQQPNVQENNKLNV